MRLKYTLPVITLGSLAIAGAAASTAPRESNEAMLAALDPTRAGRLVCRGLDSTGSTLARRLELAESLAEERQMGRGRMGLYNGIGRSDLPLGDISPLARRYFDQGLALAYGFNHAAAIRSFRLARETDPSCALCWWGEAMANGPNINAGMDSAQNKAALEALSEARRLAPASNPEVAALIAAQQARYSADPDANRAALDAAYADAMYQIAAANPGQDDLSILAAEAAMNTTPWDYWDESGNARPRIAGAVALLERVMKRNPDHPQAPHLYIHLLESPDPVRAEAAADQLVTSAPAALGHLVHMPAHIYYRIGRYADSLKANVAAVRADEAFLADVGDDGLVRYGYYPHNVHFLLTSAQMMGDVDRVISQTAKLEQIIDVETGREIAWVQAIYAAPYFALAQYGSPASVLALTERSHPLDYDEGMRHYARAVAFAQLRDRGNFNAELAALESKVDSAGVRNLVDQAFPAAAVVRIAAGVARGRLALAEGRHDDAIGHFEMAAELERELPYTEPPYWYYPVRQSLGAAYYSKGQYGLAREAFRAALVDAPNSALALWGLLQTEKKLGHKPEAAATQAALDKVWRGNDRWLDMSRI